MDRKLHRATISTCAALALAACGSEPMQPPVAPTAVVAGADQSGTPGWPLTDTLAVRVQDARGAPVAGVPVNWQTDDGSVSRAIDTTDAAGVARTVWTLGLREGTQTLRAMPAGHDPVTFTAHGKALHAVEVATSLDWGACAITTSGGTYCWPLDVGREHPEFITVPLDLTQIGVGTFYGCGLDRAAQVWCWPRPRGAPTGSAVSPELISGLPPIKQITGEPYHACGFSVDGQAYCWDPGMPSSVHPIAPGYTFSQFSAGFKNYCGLDSAGVAYCWGDNSRGQLGIGMIGDSAATPQLVSGGFHFRSIAVGDLYTCGITTDDRVLCWGDSDGSGIPTQTTVPTPAPSVRAPVEVQTSGETTMVLTAAGGLYFWGRQTFSGDLFWWYQAVPAAGPDQSGPFFAHLGGADYPCAIAVGGGVYCTVSYPATEKIDSVPFWPIRAVAPPE